MKLGSICKSVLDDSPLTELIILKCFVAFLGFESVYIAVNGSALSVHYILYKEKWNQYLKSHWPVVLVL